MEKSNQRFVPKLLEINIHDILECKREHTVYLDSTKEPIQISAGDRFEVVFIEAYEHCAYYLLKPTAAYSEKFPNMTYEIWDDGDDLGLQVYFNTYMTV